MHVVVNRLTLSKAIDADLLRKFEDFFSRVRPCDGFADLQLVRVNDTEAIILVFFTTREALDEVSGKIAAPWFAENVRPYLGGPVQRSVGEVVVQAAK